MTPDGRRRLAAYLLVVTMGVFGHWRLMEQADAIEHEAEVRAAELCATSWEARAQIREAIAIPGEAIIEVSPNADPARVAEFRDVIDRRIRDTYPDPDCDLAAALTVLGD